MGAKGAEDSGSVRQANAKRTLRKAPPGQISLSTRYGMVSQAVAQQIERWPIDRFVFYVRSPRKNAAAVDRMRARIREYRFKIPGLAEG